MTIFADSSALVKRYADEAHHQSVRSIDQQVVVSALGRVEVPSALWRKRRLGELTDEQVSVLVTAFESDWYGTSAEEPAFMAVHVTSAILDDAALHVARHELRAADAIQLATARAVRAIDATATVFAAFDARLRAAAAIERFELLPSTLS